jgi:hypothetical protein
MERLRTMIIPRRIAGKPGRYYPNTSLEHCHYRKLLHEIILKRLRKAMKKLG